MFVTVVIGKISKELEFCEYFIVLLKEDNMLMMAFGSCLECADYHSANAFEFASDI